MPPRWSRPPFKESVLRPKCWTEHLRYLRKHQPQHEHLKPAHLPTTLHLTRLLTPSLTIPNHPQPWRPAAVDGYWVYLERGVDAVRRWKAFGAADQRRLEANAPLPEELVEEEEDDEEGGWWGALGGIPSGYVKIAIENDHRNSWFTH